MFELFFFLYIKVFSVVPSSIGNDKYPVCVCVCVHSRMKLKDLPRGHHLVEERDLCSLRDQRQYHRHATTNMQTRLCALCQ